MILEVCGSHHRNAALKVSKDKRVQAHEVEGEEVEQCDGGHEPLPRIGHPLSPITVYAVRTHKSFNCNWRSKDLNQ